MLPKALPKTLNGKHILITAGPTWEMLDPVRFLSNRSSGLMGFEIAKAAVRAGARVTLISGPTSIRYRLPNCMGLSLGRRYLTVVPVVSAREMYRECLKRFPKTDIAIMAAAVSDYRPAKVARHKLKKPSGCRVKPGMTNKEMTLKLVRNPDILATLGKRKKKDQVLIGFALESRHMLAYAKDKLRRKNCDMIVANPVPTLGSSTNSATLLFKDGCVQKLPKLRKSQLATQLMRIICKADRKMY